MISVSLDIPTLSIHYFFKQIIKCVGNIIKFDEYLHHYIKRVYHFSSFSRQHYLIAEAAQYNIHTQIPILIYTLVHWYRNIGSDIVILDDNSCILRGL